MRKQTIVQIGKYAAIIFIAIILGFLILLCVYGLPTGRIIVHAAKSAETLFHESDYPNWAPDSATGILDNYTDATMISGAAYDGTEYSIAEKALLVPRVDYPSVLRVEALAYSMGIQPAASSPFTAVYPRYWHGYLLFLKPLLIAFDISQIRLLMMCIVFIVTSFTAVVVYRNLGTLYSIGLLCALLVINPVTVSMSMQFQNVYIIALVTIDVLLLMPAGRARPDLIFLISGISIAFFDFLTYPITALGLPLCVSIVYYRKPVLSDAIRFHVRNSALWFFGYVGMWSGKWILTYILTGFNAVRDGLDRIQFHSEEASPDVQGKTITSFETVHMNFDVLKSPVIVAVLLVALAMVLVMLTYKKTAFDPDNRTILLLILAGLIPFAWYAFAKNHSYVHFWFTYRSLSVWIMSLFYILADIFSNKGGCSQWTE